MAEVNKRPIVIRDLIEQATYIAEDNLDAAERFLVAAESAIAQPANLNQTAASLNKYTI